MYRTFHHFRALWRVLWLHWAMLDTEVPVFQQKMWGGAAVGVGRCWCFHLWKAASLPLSLLPSLSPSSITAAPPYINSIMKPRQMLCFDSHEHDHESFPPKLEKVTVELWLCHQKPIFHCCIKSTQEYCGLPSSRVSHFYFDTSSLFYFILLLIYIWYSAILFSLFYISWLIKLPSALGLSLHTVIVLIVTLVLHHSDDNFQRYSCTLLTLIIEIKPIHAPADHVVSPTSNSII